MASHITLKYEINTTKTLLKKIKRKFEDVESYPEWKYYCNDASSSQATLQE